MANAHAKNHDYHILPLSPWPFIGSVSAFVMAVGAVMWMKKMTLGGMAVGSYLTIAGLIGVLYTMYGWWADVVREAESGDHTRVVQMHHRYGMILFIASEVMFFVAWFWAYFDAAIFAGEAIQYARTELTGGQWPPKGIAVFNPWELPLFNTLILLTSGTTVTWAHHALLHGDRGGLVLAFRGCGVAVPLCRHLCLGFEFRLRAEHSRALTAPTPQSGRAAACRPFFVEAPRASIE